MTNQKSKSSVSREKINIKYETGTNTKFNSRNDILIESKNVRTIYSPQIERGSDGKIQRKEYFEDKDNFMEDSVEFSPSSLRKGSSCDENNKNFKIVTKEKSDGKSKKKNSEFGNLIEKIKIPSQRKIQKVLDFSREPVEGEEVRLRTSQSFDFSLKYKEILDKNLNEDYKFKLESSKQKKKKKGRLNKTDEAKNLSIPARKKFKIVKSDLKYEKKSEKSKSEKFALFLEEMSRERKRSRNADDTIQICTLNTSLVDTVHEHKSPTSNKMILKPNDNSNPNSGVKIKPNNPFKSPFSNANFVYNSPLRVDKNNKNVKKFMMKKQGGALFSFNQKSLNLNNSLKKASKTGEIGSFLEDLDGEINNINKKISDIVNLLELSEKKSSKKKKKKRKYFTPKKFKNVKSTRRKLSYGKSSKKTSVSKISNKKKKKGKINTVEINLKEFVKVCGTLKKNKKLRFDSKTKKRSKKKLEKKFNDRKKSDRSVLASNNDSNLEPESLKITRFESPVMVQRDTLINIPTRKKSYNQLYINRIYENSKFRVKAKDTQKKYLDQRRKELEMMKCTFKPKTNKRAIYEPKVGFFERQKEWMKKKEEKIKNLESTLELNRTKECVFQPILSKKNSTKNQKKSDRLSSPE